ncbi:P-loop containing nucleoside triphosphate hydrolase protein [Podospora aff. communis PSN243]|uniref:P-loop containing nucleoside triphosphate hydrolase protein n=1 Tax=Podospora aff. communis PSN243 TaxID=3040156 RepID=A0AAV9GF31_9PEZI|nr:P-loop containing nucleoside triphosphate hydrolase protein [Podospora aff. communis PSN243]
MDFSTCPSDDRIFSPAVEGCRGDFDFTIKFEKIFFDIIPASIFTAVSLTRMLFLVTRRSDIIAGSWFKLLKLSLISAYAVLQAALLALCVTKLQKFETFFIAAAALTFVASLCMLPLSGLEHARSMRPSIFFNGYLFITILLDIAQTRTLWLASDNPDELSFTRLFTSGVALKASVLVLESIQKTKWIVSYDTKQHSPEETAGIFGLSAYAWLNRIFLRGYNKILTMDDLYPLDYDMASERLYRNSARRLAPSKLRGRKHGLAGEMLKGLAMPLLMPVPARIALMAFKFCQPFLIETLLDYLHAPAGEVSRNVGYGLIGATIIVYTGIAAAGAVYWYFQTRAMYILRGVLASSVYRKTTEAKIALADDSAALTLMSVDIERIIRGWEYGHEIWANLAEAAVACWLLSRHLGPASVAPMVVVLLCAAYTTYSTRYIGPTQKAWMETIQRRVGLTSSVIGQMKQLKISGLASPVEESIQTMREEELKAGNRFRVLLAAAAVCAFAPACIAPIVTFGITNATLDIVTIFTSLAYIVLLTGPLSILFQMAPVFFSSFTCLRRIQTLIESEPRIDFRESPAERHGQTPPEKTDGDDSRQAWIKIARGSFGWEGQPILRNIDLEIPPSRLTLVVGPIGAGKSTLCKALLGESPVFDGKVLLGSGPTRKIGFCDQTPYLANDTIRKNIIGFSPWDPSRYNAVIEATMLLPDLAILPQGDQTKVGSNGISLSGGQRQRVSMARALYLDDTNLFVFDDILSGLDADTEDQVFRRVFSADGLLRRRNATVVLCTHSVRHLISADHIIALGQDGTIVEQGTFAQLLANRQYVHSLGIKETDSSSSDDDIEPVDVGKENASGLKRVLKEKVEDDGTNDPERMLGEWTVYKYYLKRIDWYFMVGFVICGLAWGFFENWVTVWLKFWSVDITSESPEHSNSFYIGLYALFQLSALTSLAAVCFICFTSMISASGARLHREALETVIRAPLKFFTSTDTGVVTNLFSQDMTLIDGELPASLLNMTLLTCSCLGMSAVIATASPYLCVTYPFLWFVLYVIQKFYLRTSRQMRLLDLEAKSPLYSHFIDTIKGIATFRAFGWIAPSIELNNHLVDNSQRPMYLLAMIQRWLAFVLQMVIAFLALSVVTFATQTKSNTAFTGASLVTLMNFGDVLTHIVQSYTRLETSIGAISRLRRFGERVAPENLPGEDVQPPPQWPLKGRIRVENVSASYDGPDDPSSNRSSTEKGINIAEKESVDEPNLAIRDLTIDIVPSEKVALCGRSGSGKSSLVLLLLRLLDPIQSSAQGIIIDETPLHKIDRGVLRQRIIAVPQDAVFLPDGTSVRLNLDPFTVSTEPECKAVLEVVGLWDFVTERGGLGAGMSADSFSQGQKQLFSLARAVLRRRVRAREWKTEFGEAGGEEAGILLLDEVSSSVDQDTERAMQAVIADEFRNYTIVMVSHRLDAVMDFDRVVVMDRGVMVESGRPRDLVEMEGSKFRKLWLVNNPSSSRSS